MLMVGGKFVNALLGGVKHILSPVLIIQTLKLGPVFMGNMQIAGTLIGNVCVFAIPFAFGTFSAEQLLVVGFVAHAGEHALDVLLSMKSFESYLVIIIASKVVLGGIFIIEAPLFSMLILRIMKTLSNFLHLAPRIMAVVSTISTVMHMVTAPITAGLLHLSDIRTFYGIISTLSGIWASFTAFLWYKFMFPLIRKLTANTVSGIQKQAHPCSLQTMFGVLPPDWLKMTLITGMVGSLAGGLTGSIHSIAFTRAYGINLADYALMVSFPSGMIHFCQPFVVALMFGIPNSVISHRVKCTVLSLTGSIVGPYLTIHWQDLHLVVSIWIHIGGGLVASFLCGIVGSMTSIITMVLMKPAWIPSFTTLGHFSGTIGIVIGAYIGPRTYNKIYEQEGAEFAYQVMTLFDHVAGALLSTISLCCFAHLIFKEAHLY